MRILIVEDDLASRRLLKTLLSKYGDCDIAVNGEEAVESFRLALEEGAPYDLICLDIMMPVMDGQQALQRIRSMEKERNIRFGREVKVLMTTALDDVGNVNEAFFKGEATSYVVKPLDQGKIVHELQSMGLIDAA
jgi:two-component system chemotaxis response regulator CheY